MAKQTDYTNIKNCPDCGRVLVKKQKRRGKCITCATRLIYSKNKVVDKKKRRISQRRWEKNNRVKKRAHQVVKYSIANGIIERKPCIECGKKAHAHHEDYSKPLEVIWMCPLHHKRHHTTN